MWNRVFFFGILGNVNYSIQLINIHDELVIEKWSRKNIINFLNKVVGIDPSEAEFRYENNYGCGKKKSAYVITGELNHTLIPSKDKSENTVAYHLRATNYFESYAHGIENKIQLLRLCSKGDIKLAIHCFYQDYGGEKQQIMSFHYETPLRDWSFHISPNQADYFNDFISKNQLPLAHEYLQLAFENFLLSYDVHDDRLSFLSLMIALETLFNDAGQEIRYRVSRGAAVFLGRTVSQSQMIFKELKKLYDKRSILVHTGDPKKISETDIFELQNYVRASLRLLIECNLSKKELCEKLTIESFGALNRIRNVQQLERVAKKRASHGADKGDA